MRSNQTQHSSIDGSKMPPIVSLVLCCVGADTDCILTGPELSPEERRRRDKQTPRIAIRKHPHSSFLHLFDSGNNQALVLNCCCGVDHSIFNNLLEMFETVFDTHLPDLKTGLCHELKRTATKKIARWPREIDAASCLRLIPSWFRTRGDPLQESCPWLLA